MKKAQIFSLDALIATGIFIVIILSVGWAWVTMKERYSISETRNDMELITQQAIASLVETPGKPVTWHYPKEEHFFDEKNVSSLGLTLGVPNFLDRQKVERMRDLNLTNYTFMKRLLGILGPNYEFYLTLSEFHAGYKNYTNTYVIGNLPNPSAKDIVVRQRMALFDNNRTDNNWTLVKLEVWR